MDSLINTPESAPKSAPIKNTAWDDARVKRVAEAREKVKNGHGGYAWPQYKLVEHTDTIKKGDLIVFAAYTGSGKTTFLLEAVKGFVEQGIQTLYFGTEQSASDLTFKMACSDLAYDLLDSNRARLTEAQKAELDGVIAKYSEAPYDKMHFHPNPSPSPEDVFKAIRHAVKHQGVEIVLLDYIGRVDLPGKNERIEMAQFVKALKNLAIELRICIIAAQQINAAEFGSDMAKHTPPKLSDIQGGSKVVHEADLVLGAFQPFLAETTDEQKKAVRNGTMSVRDIVEPDTMCIIVLKHREARRDGFSGTYWVVNNQICSRLADEKKTPDPRSIKRRKTKEADEIRRKFFRDNSLF